MKKILFIYLSPIYPIDSGSKKNSTELLTYLRNKNHNVTLLTQKLSSDYKDVLQRIANKVVEYENPLRNIIYKLVNRAQNVFKINELKKDWVFCLLLKKFIERKFAKEAFDVIILNYLKFDSILPTVLTGQRILFAHDIYYYRFQSMSRFPFKRMLLLFIQKNEIKRLKKFDFIITVADYESQLLIDNNIDKNKIVLIGAPQNIVTVDSKKTCYYYSFIGANVDQNVGAIEWFMEHIYKKTPDKSVCICGRICYNPKIIAYANQWRNVHLLGYVDSIKDFYEKSTFVIGTIQVGSGIKIKVLEAMAHGKIVLASRKSLEGINVEHEKEVLCVDGLKENDIISLLKKYENNEQYQKMSDRMKSFIKKEYSADKCFGGLNTLICNL